MMPPVTMSEHDTHQLLLTMSTAIAAGALLIVVARRLGLPSIVLLLIGGYLLGPEIWGADNSLVKPNLLEQSGGLRVIVSLAVGLILFEGGLTLDLTGYRTAPTMIRRLLTLGVLITWLSIAGAIWLVFDFGQEWRIPILASSLVIVTGPTVIAPLLKRIKVQPTVHNILHWEGVLIDPIGVFIALLCFEWTITEASGVQALINLGLRVAAGLGIGAAGGAFITFAVRRKFVPEELLNVFALACAVVVFGLSEAVQSEAGLLGATVAGFVFGVLTGPSKLKSVRQFKGEITDLLIGTLFILLASRLSVEQFKDFGVQGALIVGIVMIVVRPLSIVLCSIGLDLNTREKAFLGWVAPRGIVAASMASLFAITISSRDPDAASEARFIETFVYSVIIATILLQGLTASPLARLLGLRRAEPTGWLIIGANLFARRVAQFMARAADEQVVLIDTNARRVREARDDGMHAIVADARDVSIHDRTDLQLTGNLLALTDNEDLNVRLCQIWRDVFGPGHVFRCNPTGAGPREEEKDDDRNGRVIWERLPRPSLLAGELMRGEARLIETPLSRASLSLLAQPIALVHNRRIEFDTKAIAETSPTDTDRALLLQREADYLMRSLDPQLVSDAEAETQEALFDQLVERVAARWPEVPKDELVRELLEREKSIPTALGHGVAVPHAYSSALGARVCAVARVSPGVDFGAADGEPVRLVFLLLSPPGDPEGHLATLADIARLVTRAETREAILEAESPEDMLVQIRRAHRA